MVYPFVHDLLNNPYFHDAVSFQLHQFLGFDVKLEYLFARMSPAGVHCPHQAHNDEVMAPYSLMIYMNRLKDCQGGTSLLRHRGLGFSTGPLTPEMHQVVLRDQNTPAAWDIAHLCEMKPNRAFIFKSPLFHRAEPVIPTTGFGNTQENSRLVLTAFFREQA